MAYQQDSGSIPVSFKIKKWSSEPVREEIRIITSKFKHIRTWDLKDTLRTIYQGNEFSLEVLLPRNRVMWYKLLRLRARDKKVLQVEPFERELILVTHPVMVRLEFNVPGAIIEVRPVPSPRPSPMPSPIESSPMPSPMPSPINMTRLAASGSKSKGAGKVPDQCSEAELHKACGDKRRGPPTAKKPARRRRANDEGRHVNEDAASRASLQTKVAKFQSAWKKTQTKGRVYTDRERGQKKDDACVKGKSVNRKTESSPRFDNKWDGADKKGTSGVGEDGDSLQSETESDDFQERQAELDSSQTEPTESQESETGSFDSQRSEQWVDVGEESGAESAYGEESESVSAYGQESESIDAQEGEGESANGLEHRLGLNDGQESEAESCDGDQERENVREPFHGSQERERRVESCVGGERWESMAKLFIGSLDRELEAESFDSEDSYEESLGGEGNEAELARNQWNEEESIGGQWGEADSDMEDESEAKTNASPRSSKYQESETKPDGLQRKRAGSHSSQRNKAAQAYIRSRKNKLEYIKRIEEELADCKVKEADLDDSQESDCEAAGNLGHIRASSSYSLGEEWTESTDSLDEDMSESTSYQSKRSTGFSFLRACLVYAFDLSGGFPKYVSIYTLYKLFKRK